MSLGAKIYSINALNSDAAKQCYLNSSETQALLDRWNEAVSISMRKLLPDEQEEINKFSGPDEIVANLRDRLQLAAQGKMKSILDQISPFFDVLQELLLLTTAVMAGRPMLLALVLGGAYLAVKVCSPSYVGSALVTVLATSAKFDL